MQNYVGLAQPTTVCFVAKRPTHICVVSGLNPSTNEAKTPPRGSEIVGLGQQFASRLCATVFSKMPPRVWKICNRKGCGLQKTMQSSTGASALRLQRKLAHHCCTTAQGVDILPFPLGKKKFLNLLKKCAQLCLQIFNYVV